MRHGTSWIRLLTGDLQENRINRLNEFGILSVYRGRQNIIDLSDDIKNVI